MPLLSLLFLFVFAGTVCGFIAIYRCKQLRRRISVLENALGMTRAAPFSVFLDALTPVHGVGVAVSLSEVEEGALKVAEVVPVFECGDVVSSEPESKTEFVVPVSVPVSAAGGGGYSSAESFIGGKLFAWLGALCLFVCLGYFAKYSIDNNLISPAVRVLSIYVFGAALIGFGVYFGQRTRFILLSEVFLSVGVLAFYIATIAAYRFYQLPGYSFEVAVLALVLITGLALGLASVMSSRTIACLSLIGGFVTPFMLDIVSPEASEFVWYLVVYLGVLNVGALLLSGLKRWSFTVLLGISGSLIVFLVWLCMGLSVCGCLGIDLNANLSGVGIEDYMCMSLVLLGMLSVLYAGFSFWRRVWGQMDGFCVLTPLWLLSAALWVFFAMAMNCAYSAASGFGLVSNIHLLVYVVLAVLSFGLAVCVGFRTSFGIVLYVSSLIFANIFGFISLCREQGGGVSWGYIVSALVLIVFAFFAAGLCLSLRREQVVSAKGIVPWYLYASVLGGVMLLSLLGLGCLGPFSPCVMMGVSLSVVVPLIEQLSILILVGLSLWACMRWRFPWLGASLVLGVAFATLFLPHGLSIEIESFLLLYLSWCFLLEVSILLIVLAPFFCRKSSEGSAGLWISSALVCPMSFLVFQMHCELFGWEVSSSVLFLVVMLPSLFSIGYLWLKGRMSAATVSAYAGVAVVCSFIFSLMQFDGWNLVLALMVEVFVLMWVARYFGLKMFAWVVACLSVMSFICALSVPFVPVVDMWALPGLNVYLWQLGLPLLLMMASYWIMPAFSRVVNLLLVLGGALLFLLLNLEIANFFTPEASSSVLWVANSFAHSLAYSCAWGLFALCLLMLGFIKYNKVLRWVGLALLASTLFKVLCFDTVSLRELYRVLSLLITAALVIGASVFYQKWVSMSKAQAEDKK